MKKRILIANRGEIAVRVMKTAHEMGFETVAVYAEDDKDLKFVTMAHHKISLGAGSPSETYLNQNKIIGAAKKYKVWGIHPGYGFLSENASFCERAEREGFSFIGATIQAMKIMGDKKESKIHMANLDVPLIPGYHGTDQDGKTLLSEAKKIGFPVLIKATAGGGGKGMRIVHQEKDFLELLESAKSEAKKSFDNDFVLIEKYLTKPRHIEVQVMSDTHGNHLHFFERECSIQRRYQKIIEETPSPALTTELREEICQTAVKIAKGINYRGAGTLEFILDENNKFYFLEMNTRLQVEHPITEMITGADLVRLQIEVALGNKIELKQSDITSQGHSIECRIYAENPDKNFMPTSGTIEYIGSSNLDNIRIETGYVDGNEVNVNYDPMIAKLVVKSTTRDQAINKMNLLLNDCPFLGIKTNREYLKRVLKNDAFIKGDIDTNFVTKHDLSPRKFDGMSMALLIAAKEFVQHNNTNQNQISINAQNSWDLITGFRNS